MFLSQWMLRPSASPTRAALRAGKVFTSLVLLTALAGVVIQLISDSVFSSSAILLMIGATVLYLIGAILLWVRGDYILRMFGTSWPMILAKVDEMQRIQRAEAFAFTYRIVMSLFCFGIGAHVGILLSNWFRQTRLGLDQDHIELAFYPGSLADFTMVGTFIFFAMTLIPQAYLAWTLTPLDDEEDT